MALPITLQEKLKAGLIVPFVGAGVSMAVHDMDGKRLFPSWSELLKEAATRLDADHKSNRAAMVRLALDDNDYLLAAEQAEKGLKGDLPRIIKGQVDIPRGKIKDESLELASLIWQLGSRYVLTTNYDRVLEWACPQAGNCQKILNSQNYELNEILRGNVLYQSVWHLHGHIQDANSIVLTPKSYARLYPNGNKETEWKAALETLRNIIATKSLLFIGYGLGDVQIIEQLDEIEVLFGGASGPHYILATKDLASRINDKGINVEVIPYEKHGEPLLKVMRKFVEVVTPPTNPDPVDASADFDPRHPSYIIPFRSKGNQVLGREEQLSKVRELLLTGTPTEIGQTASFHGIGGLGKTQLAVEYAHKFGHTYPNGLVWITADGDIDSQLTELAQKAKWIAPKTDHKIKLDVALNRVRSYSDCLLIFDNVENIKDIEPYLPEHAANPHILITSRTPQPGFSSISLELLKPDVSLALLYQEANTQPSNVNEIEAAKNIVKNLDYLPLAIELAGAFIKFSEGNIGWERYNELLSTDMTEALATHPQFRSFTHHQDNLYKTLHIDEGILEKYPRLREILDVLTWSGSTPMCIDLLSKMLDVKSILLERSLAVGVSLKLLQKNPDSSSYAIHRLVRQVRQKEIPLEERTGWIETMALNLGNWFEDKRNYSTHLPEYEREIEHLATWREHSSHFAGKEEVRLLWLQAYPAFHRGHYEESKLIADQALQMYQATKIVNKTLESHLLEDKANFTSLNNLGTTYELNQLEEALELHHQALAIRREVLGEKHQDTANSLNNLGYTYSKLNQSEKALELHHQALAIRREVLGEKHQDTANLLNNLGYTYSELNQPEKARELHQQALEMKREIEREKHDKNSD